MPGGTLVFPDDCPTCGVPTVLGSPCCTGLDVGDWIALCATVKCGLCATSIEALPAGTPAEPMGRMI